MAGKTDSPPPPPYQGQTSSEPAAQANYGPTPLPNAQSSASPHLLPYYDPTSPHSLRLAETRANHRFISALFWAVTIYVALGLFSGGVAVNYSRRAV